MTPRLAPADEEAIAAAAEARASARRQLDAEALVAARLAELRAGRLDGRVELAGGRIIEWEWEGRGREKRLVCYLVASMGMQRARIGSVEARPRGVVAEHRGEHRFGFGDEEEAMVWVEGMITGRSSEDRDSIEKRSELDRNLI